MLLDSKTCAQARISRDPRFDGKFFIGVQSTKIYCRSICPVPTVKEANVRYFPTAAAAAERGYRPCLRCRPECSPGTPAWDGTSSTVARGLRLIAESGLEDDGVEGLAERLGVGSRHLRRLFLQHLGAPPRTVAHTRRLHFAKKLIDETTLSMMDIALASGFGCVRRFNAAIRKTYKRTPTQIRKLSQHKTTPPESEYVFQLRFRPPYHWKGMLAFLASRALPGVEAIQGQSYLRSIWVNGHAGSLEVSPNETHDSLLVRLHIGDARALYSTMERVRSMFDLNADWAVISDVLGADPTLAKWMKSDPGLRVAGCWDPFELAVRTIVGEADSTKRAIVLTRRIVESFGRRIEGPGPLTHVFPSPEVLADATLNIPGITPARANAVRALARAICDEEISFEGVVDTDALLAPLCDITRISKREAQYVAMRALAEPDAFPISTASLTGALGLSSSQDARKRAENWRPWRAYASMYLWHSGVARSSLMHST